MSLYVFIFLFIVAFHLAFKEKELNKLWEAACKTCDMAISYLESILEDYLPHRGERATLFDHIIKSIFCIQISMANCRVDPNDVSTYMKKIQSLFFDKCVPEAIDADPDYLDDYQVFEDLHLFLTHLTRSYRHPSDKIRFTMMEIFSGYISIATNQLEKLLLEDNVENQILGYIQGLYEPLEKLKLLEDLQTEILNDSLSSDELRKFLDNLEGLARATVSLSQAQVQFTKTKFDNTLETDLKLRFVHI